MNRWQALAVVTLLLVAGCSDPKKDGPSEGAGGDSSTAGSTSIGVAGDTTGPTGDAGAAGTPGEPAAACNDLELDAPAYELTYDAAPAPEAIGGEIPDGTYFLTSQIMYESAPGPVLALGRVKVVIAGDIWQEVSGDADGDPINDRASTSSFSVGETWVTLTRTCPSEGTAETPDFSADADGFTLYVLDGGSTFGTVFTRQ